MGRGINGLLVKAWGASDYVLTVTSNKAITDHYVCLGFTGGALLADHPVHPTQWIRLWVPNEKGNVHQRGYTLVDSDAAADTFDIEFAIHDGAAARWAQAAKPGDTIEASVLGSKFEVPDPMPSEFLMFGDTASLPAINSLLHAIGDTPARVWLEWQHESDTTLPVHAGPATEVTFVQRVDDGQGLRDVAEALSCKPDAYAWIACDGATTRAITKSMKTTHQLPKTAIKAQAYWR